MKKKNWLLSLCLIGAISSASVAMASCDLFGGFSDRSSSSSIMATEGVLYELSADGAYAEVIGYEGTETSVYIANSYNNVPVTGIRENAFFENENIRQVTISDSVTSIGRSAFAYCSNLTNIVIPDSVTFIGECAFIGCTSLTSVIIPDNVTSIGRSAFAGCSNLTSITIPNSVTSIGNHAFAYCTSLTEIVYNATECADLSFINYVFADAGQNGEGITVKIGANVKKIPAHLFNTTSYAPKITSVVFEEGSVCESIGNYAFHHCSILTSITIPDNVTSIGEHAFIGCTSLIGVIIPDSVTSIGNSAFAGCSNLTFVYYKGTESDWANISIGSYNSYLKNATRYYYSENPPTTEGNWWY